MHELRSPQGSGSPKSPSCSLGFCQMPYGFSFDASSSCNPQTATLMPQCSSSIFYKVKGHPKHFQTKWINTWGI